MFELVKEFIIPFILVIIFIVIAILERHDTEKRRIQRNNVERFKKINIKG